MSDSQETARTFLDMATWRAIASAADVLAEAAEAAEAADDLPESWTSVLTNLLAPVADRYYLSPGEVLGSSRADYERCSFHSQAPLRALVVSRLGDKYRARPPLSLSLPVRRRWPATTELHGKVRVELLKEVLRRCTLSVGRQPCRAAMEDAGPWPLLKLLDCLSDLADNESGTGVKHPLKSLPWDVWRSAMFWTVTLDLRGEPFLHALAEGQSEAIAVIRDPSLDLVLLHIVHQRPVARHFREGEGSHGIRLISAARPDLPIVTLLPQGASVDDFGYPAVREGAFCAVSIGEPHDWARTFRRFYTPSWKKEWKNFTKECPGRWRSPDDTKDFGPFLTFNSPTTDREFHHIFEGGAPPEQALKWKYLLDHLFPTARKLQVVRVMTEGLSNTHTLIVEPLHAGMKGEAAPSRRTFVKLGPRNQIRDEERCFRDVIRPRLSNYVARVERSVHEISDTAAMAYSVVGSESGRDLRNLSKFLRDAVGRQDTSLKSASGPADVLAVLRRIYSDLLSDLHGDGRDNDPSCESYLEAFGRFLPPLGDVVAVVPPTDAGSSSKTAYTIHCPPSGTRREYWHTHIRELHGILQRAQEGEHQGREEGEIPLLLFDAWPVWEVEESKMGKPGEVQIFHPPTGLRIRATFPTSLPRPLQELPADPRLRRGHPVTFLAKPCRATISIIRAALQKAGLEPGVPGEGGPGDPERFDPYVRIPGAVRHAHTGDVPFTELPDPLAFFVQWLHTLPLGRVHRSTVHGDLNLDNVMLTGQEEISSVWLIDFFNAERMGATARDFVKLEVEMRTHILCDAVYQAAEALFADKSRGERLSRCADACSVWERGLSWRLDQISQYEPAVLSRLRHGDCDHCRESAVLLEQPGVQLVWDAVRAVRAMAKGERINDEEYLHGLYGYSLACVRFSNFSDEQKHVSAPLPQLVALQCAAWYSHWIQQRQPSVFSSDKTTINVPDILGSRRRQWSEREGLDVLRRVVRQAPAPMGLERAQQSPVFDEKKEVRIIARTAVALLKSAIADRSGGGNAIPSWISTPEEIWDVASTGSAGGAKTPILLAACLAAGGKKVLKASSTGSFAGTIDILRTTGAEVDEIGAVELSNHHRLAIVSERGLSRLEANLFDLRRQFRQMRIRTWVLISILTKKLVSGCRNVLLEVNVAFDSKCLAVGQSQDGLIALWMRDPEQRLREAQEFQDLFRQVLKELNEQLGDLAPPERASREERAWYEAYARHYGDEICGKTVLANSFHLRGRALGRWASMMEILAVLAGENGDTSEPLRSHLGNLLCRFEVPDVVEIPPLAARTLWEALKAQGASAEALLGPLTQKQSGTRHASRRDPVSEIVDWKEPWNTAREWMAIFDRGNPRWGLGTPEGTQVPDGVQHASDENGGAGEGTRGGQLSRNGQTQHTEGSGGDGAPNQQDPKSRDLDLLDGYQGVESAPHGASRVTAGRHPALAGVTAAGYVAVLRAKHLVAGLVDDEDADRDLALVDEKVPVRRIDPEAMEEAAKAAREKFEEVDPQSATAGDYTFVIVERSLANRLQTKSQDEPPEPGWFDPIAFVGWRSPRAIPDEVLQKVLAAFSWGPEWAAVDEPSLRDFGADLSTLPVGGGEAEAERFGVSGESAPEVVG